MVTRAHALASASFYSALSPLPCGGVGGVSKKPSYRKKLTSSSSSAGDHPPDSPLPLHLEAMPSPAAPAVASSPRSISFFRFRGDPDEPACRARRQAGQAPPAACGTLDRAAAWVGNGVAAAFFASLERCSCINIATADDVGEEDAKDVPLIGDVDGNARSEWAVGSRRRKKGGKGKKKGGSLFVDGDFMDDKC